MFQSRVLRISKIYEKRKCLTVKISGFSSCTRPIFTKYSSVCNNISKTHIGRFASKSSGANGRGGNSESFLNPISTCYIESLYEDWVKDPTSVQESWANYFSSLGPEESDLSNIDTFNLNNTTNSSSHVTKSNGITDHLRVQGIIRSYQIRGHIKAKLDPLNMPFRLNTNIEDELKSLEMQNFNLDQGDLDRIFKLPTTTFIGGSNEQQLSLREIIKRLKTVYCGSVGVECSFVTERDLLQWIRAQFETPNSWEISNETRRMIHKRLLKSTNLEEYLAKKWSSEKRFGLEGCEVLIPALQTIIDKSALNGVENFIIGMPHRGRLNVIANILDKSLESIFSQFENLVDGTQDYSGDVKYHLGLNEDVRNDVADKDVNISLLANPSHLEAVDPIVLGKARAQQFYNNDPQGNKTMGILMHGDAAFSGQGVVYETLHLGHLPQYTANGVIHIVVNNQIGFTTDPRDARSSLYCTDVAKVINAPILHVNADDAEAVVHVARVAAEWRKLTKRDIVIDLVCYRRNGHNEMDEPQFTQPKMYEKIRSLPKLFKSYSQKLMDRNVISKEDHESLIKTYADKLEQTHRKALQGEVVANRLWLDSPWDNFFNVDKQMVSEDTGISLEMFKEIGNVFCQVPQESKVNIYKGLHRVLNQRKKLLDQEKMDWAMCEAMAFGSLLLNKIHVRLSGQDVERGTFSHRHHVFVDQKILGRKYVPLNNISDQQAEYTVCNSSLSEFAVMGFELGFSMHNPNSLICWEAQFGDFANNAQCIIDQFLSAGQAKWIRQCGLVLLLPHGMEGMGPEHSYARLSRFLQMSNDDPDVRPALNNENFEIQQLHESNWIIICPTTPANMFHALRRQVCLPFRKPLIVMTPKSLLRHTDVRSDYSDIAEGSAIQRVIPEDGKYITENVDQVKKLIFCSGKVYYDLIKERANKELQNDIAVTRIEQLSPFPYDLVTREMKKYPNAEFRWVQEEHKNMGAWSFVEPRFIYLLKDMKDARNIKYVGRHIAAATATGQKNTHFTELGEFLQKAMYID